MPSRMPAPAPLGVLQSAVTVGVEATLVTVEVHRGKGVPMVTIVGLPGKSVRESLDRIHGACSRSGVPLEPRRTTINLAPADHPKTGTGFDLPIALGILIAEGTIPADRFAGTVSLGELQLDGSVRSVPGVLPAALAARCAGVSRLLVPTRNAAEAASVEGVTAVPVDSVARSRVFSERMVAWVVLQVPQLSLL